MDLIERQDAIDVILADKIVGSALIVMNALGDGRLALTLNDACDRHIRDIEKLPSTEPERKKGKWIGKSGSLHYCSECGWALMDSERGEPPYMGIDYHRENPERWMCCPGWNEWLMNFCPNCGADMRGESDGD